MLRALTHPEKKMRLTLAIVLATFVAMAPALGQSRRAAPPTAAAPTAVPSPAAASVTPPPAHNVGVLLATTDLYDLYEYRMHHGWCADGHAAVVILFKVDENYVIDVDDVYKQRFTREILPIIRAQCDPLRRVAVFHHVKGVILSGEQEFGYEQAASVQREHPLSSMLLPVDAQGGVRFPEELGGFRSVAQMRAHLNRNRAASEQERLAQQKRQEEAAEAERRLTALTRTPDGLLRLDGLSNEHKTLFLSIYDEQFIELARVDREHYRPFQAYTALLQGYGDKCRASLSDPAPQNFYGERLVSVEYQPYVTTEYYEKFLRGTVYVERKYAAAYQAAGANHLTRMGQYWRRNMAGDSIVAFYLSESAKGLGIGMASHRLVDINGCGSPGLMKFIETLTRYVSGNWTTRTASGGYRYSEEVTGGKLTRRYERVPAGHMLEFAAATGDRNILMIVNEADGTDGLRFVEIKMFDLTPFAMKQKPVRATPAVQAAIDQRKYQVASCLYNYSTHSTTLYFWNGKAPLPSAEIQEFARGVIDEPRTTCPAAPPAR